MTSLLQVYEFYYQVKAKVKSDFCFLDFPQYTLSPLNFDWDLTQFLSYRKDNKLDLFVALGVAKSSFEELTRNLNQRNEVHAKVLHLIEGYELNLKDNLSKLIPIDLLFKLIFFSNEFFDLLLNFIRHLDKTFEDLKKYIRYEYRYFTPQPFSLKIDRNLSNLLNKIKDKETETLCFTDIDIVKPE